MSLALDSKRVDVGKVISMTKDVVSLFQQEQDDDDNNKTSCSIDVGRAQDEDTSLATGIKSNASAIADANEQQQHWHSNQQQSTRQTMQQRMGERGREGGPGEEREREKGRNDEGGRGQEGKRKEEERETEVKKDMTDWTVVTRNRRQRKMVQIFVKVNGSKATPMEVSLTDDRVEDVVRQIPSSEDMYVTMHERVLKRSETLRSCGVTDGCMIQVTSRMRGGGRHRDKKSKVENTQVTRQEPVRNGSPAILESEKEAVIQMLEETEEKRTIVEKVSRGSDVDVEWKMRYWASKLQERPGGDVLECGLRWAVEARRKKRGEEKRQQEQEEQRRQARQEQNKQGKQVRFRRRRTVRGDESGEHR